MNIESFMHHGNEIHYRWVYVDELGEEVRVGIEDEYERYLSDDMYVDDMFSCYIPRDVFESYSDGQLRDYIERDFYD